MAVIYYRFRSQKPDHVSTIKFDGTGLTVFELKREIIVVNDLIHSNDIDIVLYSTENIQSTTQSGADADKELTDDNEVVPRSSTVLVRRTMCPKKGRGNVQRYVAGKPRVQTGSAVSRPATTALGSAILGGGPTEGSEDDMLNKVFNQQDEQWLETQDAMATATRIDTFRPAQNEPVPDYYICYKCGEKGKHNIKNCPKNNDPNWEGVRVRKTTGIPKSQLKAIAKPDEMDMEKLPNGTTTYMVNDEGKYVVAVADTKAWEQFQNIKKGENSDRNNGEIAVEDGELKDTQTGMLWKNPVRTPCCGKIYSRKFIEDALIESDFTCPNCHKDQIFIDDLLPNDELQKKVDEYMKNLTDEQSLKPAKRHQPGAVGVQPNGTSMLQMPNMMPNMNTMPMMPMMPMQQLNMPFMPFLPINNQNSQNNNNNAQK